MMPNSRHFLIVEDNLGDARLVSLMLGELPNPPVCTHIATGSGALAYLHSEEPYQNARRPDLILLDLNLPGVNGHEVLRSIKSDPALRSIPVLILSSSRNTQDIHDCYNSHANAYLTKPIELSDTEQIVQSIQRFWLGTVMLAR